MTVLRSTIFAFLFYTMTTVMVLMGLPLIVFASRKTMSRWTRLWALGYCWLTRNIVGIRLQIEGEVPTEPTLIASKHESAYETMALVSLIPDPIIVLKRELADIPLFGRITRRHGVIPVDRTASAAALREMLHAADDAKTQHRSVLIFPEGTRVPHGTAPKLQAGFAGLYGRLALPVVPVATDAGIAWPRGFLKRSGVIRFCFGVPIVAGLPRKEIEAQVHAAINLLN